MTQLARLGDVADVIAGVGFPKDMQSNEQAEIPVFKVGDISAAWTSGQRLLRSSRNYLTRDEAKSLGKLVPAGTTVFAKIGEALRLNRRAVLAQPSLVDNNVMGLIPRPKVLAPMYLFYFMQTVELGNFSRATAVPSIRKSDVVGIAIPLPPVTQQEDIVAEIEKQFSRLDEAVANLTRVKANLKRYKASVLKDAVEGRLVPTEAELARREGRTYETGAQLLQRILNVRRSLSEGKVKHKDPVEPGMIALPQIPGGWVWVSLDALAWDSAYGTSDKCSYENTGPAILRIPNVQNGKLDLGDVKFAPVGFVLSPFDAVDVGDMLVIN